MKFAVLISGGGTNLQSLIDGCMSGYINGEISLVFSNKADAYGLERAKEANIPTQHLSYKDFNDDEKYDEALIKLIEESGAEFVVLAGYLRILTKTFIMRYRNKIINIHPSLIPSFAGDGYYGIKVHESAIKRGVKISGATVHIVNEETDGGPIVIQEAVPVYFNDTAIDLQKRVLEVEHRILPLAVKLFIEKKIEIIDGRVRCEY